MLLLLFDPDARFRVDPLFAFVNTITRLLFPSRSRLRNLQCLKSTLILAIFFKFYHEILIENGFYLRFRRRSRRDDEPDSREFFNIAILLPTAVFSPALLMEITLSLSSSSSIALIYSQIELNVWFVPQNLVDLEVFKCFMPKKNHLN